MSLLEPALTVEPLLKPTDATVPVTGEVSAALVNWFCATATAALAAATAATSAASFSLVTATVVEPLAPVAELPLLLDLADPDPAVVPRCVDREVPDPPEVDPEPVPEPVFEPEPVLEPPVPEPVPVPPVPEPVPVAPVPEPLALAASCRAVTAELNAVSAAATSLELSRASSTAAEHVVGSTADRCAAMVTV
ncbi:hypothetical protein [uncultured Jatrophihabitans sp.]|uniref:hypothetical protein n=1 Tax=uncultured Jatrophihabitans sp. TaxID=1610747 RepID=UPI0035CB6D4B